MTRQELLMRLEWLQKQRQEWLVKGNTQRARGFNNLIKRTKQQLEELK